MHFSLGPYKISWTIGSERLNNLPKVTQLEKAELRVGGRRCSLYFHMAYSCVRACVRAYVCVLETIKSIKYSKNCGR